MIGLRLRASPKLLSSDSCNFQRALSHISHKIPTSLLATINSLVHFLVGSVLDAIDAIE